MVWKKRKKIYKDSSFPFYSFGKKSLYPERMEIISLIISKKESLKVSFFSKSNVTFLLNPKNSQDLQMRFKMHCYILDNTRKSLNCNLQRLLHIFAFSENKTILSFSCIEWKNLLWDMDVALRFKSSLLKPKKFSAREVMYWKVKDLISGIV